MSQTETSHETQSDSVTLPKGHERSNGRLKRLPHRAVLLIFAVAAAAVLTVGVPYVLHLLSVEKTDDAFIEGTVVPISSRVAGHVAKVFVNDNQWVHSGDTLVELDPSDFQMRVNESEATLQTRQINVELTQISSSTGLDQAAANVKAAEASVQSAEAKSAATESAYEQAEAQLASAKAALEQIQAEITSAEAQHQRDADDLRRYQDMAKNLIASQQQLDHAGTAERISEANLVAVKGKLKTQQMLVSQAEAGLKAARDNVQQAKSGVEFSKAQLDQAKARLAEAKAAPQQVALTRSQAEAAKAELEQARLNLSYTKITAPCDGYVTKKSIEPGAYIQPGQSLMAIVPPDIWVVANFKETQLTHIRAGQPVSVEVDTYPGIKFKAHVDSLQRGSGARFSLLPPENATGNYVKVVQRVPVKIVFDDTGQLEQYLLAPGMSVVPEVDISDSSGPAVAHVPGDSKQEASAATISTSSPGSGRTSNEEPVESVESNLQNR